MVLKMKTFKNDVYWVRESARFKQEVFPSNYKVPRQEFNDQLAMRARRNEISIYIYSTNFNFPRTSFQKAMFYLFLFVKK